MSYSDRTKRNSVYILATISTLLFFGLLFLYWTHAANQKPGLNKKFFSELRKGNLLSYNQEPRKTETQISKFVIRRKVDFNNHPIGPYSPEQYFEDWKCCKLHMPNTTQISEVDGEKVLTNYYPEGTWGRGGGLNQWSDLRDSPDDIEEIYFTYRIKFEEGFDWGIGNKLPGLAFGKIPKIASGGDGPKIGDLGSTIRMSWHSEGRIRLYVYHHSMKQKYGEDLGLGYVANLKSGEWYTVTMRVVANDELKSNGIIQIWINDELVGSVDNANFRTPESPKLIQSVGLQTFMGGGDERFASKKNQYMFMDDFYYWQYSEEFLQSNPSIARDKTLHSPSDKLVTPLSN